MSSKKNISKTPNVFEDEVERISFREANQNCVIVDGGQIFNTNKIE